MNTKFRQRFVKDYNLPINVFREDMFKYYMDLYDFFPKETYENIQKIITDKFNGNVELWLDFCAKFRDYAIESVITSEKYIAFNNGDITKYTQNKLSCGERTYYTEETHGKMFLSIDLKKANFQALKFIGVLDDENYDKFVDRFGGDEYLKGSKYLRQVIFGKMNPSRTIAVEKYIMFQIHGLVNSLAYTNVKDFLTLYSANSDELVYLIDDSKLDFSKELIERCHSDLLGVETLIKNFYGVDVRCEIVKIKRLPIVNCNENKVEAFVRQNVLTGEEKLKKASTTFYPQIYKLWKGMELETKDLIFYDNDQLATFLEPLRLIKE